MINRNELSIRDEASEENNTPGRGSITCIDTRKNHAVGRLESSQEG